MIVIDHDGWTVYNGGSDAECVRWWRREGEPGDRMKDTGELMSEVARGLGLEP